MMLKSGDVISAVALPEIVQSQLNLYAQASGDFNPIHLNEAEAKKVGLPGVIAHGMLSAGMLAERGRQLAEDHSLALKPVRFQCRFKSMVSLGDTIFISGAVKEASPVALILDLVAKNQKGETVTTATIEYRKV